jgi:hypothetical protein
MAQHPTRQPSSHSSPREPDITQNTSRCVYWRMWEEGWGLLEAWGSCGMNMKMTAFWDTAPCSLTDISEVRTASIIRAMNHIQCTSTRLHGAISLKAIVFKETDVSMSVANLPHLLSIYLTFYFRAYYRLFLNKQRRDRCLLLIRLPSVILQQ